MSAALESNNIGPLRFETRRRMDGREYVVNAADLAPAGDWQLRVEARRGQFELFTETVSVPIEEGER